MVYVELGRSGLKVSRLTLGCEPLGGTDWGSCDLPGITRAIHVALEAGINTFDVADVYGLGLAEERLAEALGEQRKDAVIVTKFGVAWEADPCGHRRARTCRDASPQRVVVTLEASLRRLRIDCIPVYLVHWPDPDTPIEDTVDALERCKAAGKVHSYGLSNFQLDTVYQILSKSDVTVIENEYSLVQRAAESLLAHAAAEKLGVLVYGTLASGLLSGRYSSESRFPVGDRRHRGEAFGHKNWQRNQALLQDLRKLADLYHRSPAEIAIGWVLGNAAVTSAIIGARSAEQVESIVRVVDFALSEADRASISGDC